MSFEPLFERLRARARRVSAALSDAEARARLAANDGPIELALEFERALGGLSVAEHELGLGTHATHPPRDAYDEWLDRDFQREMIQIAFGGPFQATYWLDRRGWVHSIGPLDRLRAHADSVPSFLRFLLGERGDGTHHAVIALVPCTAEDADAIFGARPGCPVGDGVVRLDPDASDALEERAWVARELPAPNVVLSARSLERLLPALATYLALEPTVDVVLLDGEPRPAYDDPIVDVLVTHPYRIPHDPTPFAMTIGRDADGALHAVRR